MSDGPAIPIWTLADRLYKARTDAGLTQPEIAYELGMSPRQIVRYEKGEIAPSKATVLAWAHITQVPIDWITGAKPGVTEPMAERRRSRRQRRGGATVVTHIGDTDRATGRATDGKRARVATFALLVAA